MCRIFFKITFIIMIICLFSFFTGCKGESKSSKKKEPAQKVLADKKEKPSTTDDAAAVPSESVPTGDPSANVGVAGNDGTASSEGANITDGDANDYYDYTGKIDPFKPLFSEETITGVGRPRDGGNRPLTPLERVDLSQLKHTATIIASSGNRAMVTDSSGKGYVVVVGTYIGINNGRVSQILMDKIVVEEEVENILGKVSIHKRELKLQKPPGE